MDRNIITTAYPGQTAAHRWALGVLTVAGLVATWFVRGVLAGSVR